MKKLVLAGILVLVVAVGVGVYFLLSNLNSLVASAIEKNGSKVTQTTVSVSGVDIQLREGRGSIKGLQVDSPEGFHVGSAFLLGDITVDLDVASVRENPIVLDEVRIRAPEVRVEVKKDGDMNIEELRKRIQAYTGKKPADGEKSTKRIRIKTFVFEKGRVEVDATALGAEKRTLDLPAIRLSNVGGENGVPPDEVAKLILTTYAKKTAAEVASSEINRLIEDKVKGKVEDEIQEKAKGILDKIGN